MVSPEDITAYFGALDDAIAKVSHGDEGVLARLRGWILGPREIVAGLTPDGGFAVRVAGSAGPQDTLEWINIDSDDEMNRVLGPGKIRFRREGLGSMDFLQIGDMVLVPKNPLEPSVELFPGILGVGRADQAAMAFSEDRAREDAINLWNLALTGQEQTGNFVHEARSVFQTFQAIVKRKSFLERRIHRFINQQAQFLLPSHKRCFFEHRLRSKGEERVADFVLDRGAGVPALLIELESPVHPVFRRDGGTTASVTHAREQIAEWVRFIDDAPEVNAAGEFAFLRGPKERMVVIGRGLEDRERLLESRYTDTILWTYHLLLEEAKGHWNDHVESQRKLVGLIPARPF